LTGEVEGEGEEADSRQESRGDQEEEATSDRPPGSSPTLVIRITLVVMNDNEWLNVADQSWLMTRIREEEE